MPNADTLRATVDQIDDGVAVLALDDAELTGRFAGQLITLPKRYLPKATKEGDALILELMTDEEATASREQVARTLLEDILNGK